MQVEVRKSTPKPWQAWGLTARYVIVQLAQAVPTALLLWLSYVHH